MTPKHRERIENLLAALDDYKFQTEFKRVDNDVHEYNAILTLETKLRGRLRHDPIEED